MIHVPFDRRYSPVSDTYYSFVSDEDGESRRLFYHIEGKGSTLIKVGEVADKTSASLVLTQSMIVVVPPFLRRDSHGS